MTDDLPEWWQMLELTDEQRAEKVATLKRIAERFPCPQCGWTPDD